MCDQQIAIEYLQSSSVLNNNVPRVKLEDNIMIFSPESNTSAVGSKQNVYFEHFLTKEEVIPKTDLEHSADHNYSMESSTNMYFNSEEQLEIVTACTLCKKVFRTQSALQRHLKIHNGKLPYCEICNKTFTQQSNLWKHVHIHTGEKKFECNICKKRFSQKANLNKHKLIHEGRKPHSCLYCDKSFAQRANLLKHIRIHTGEKPFICEHCNKAFAQQSNLQKHSLIHKGIKPYNCPNCDSSFTQHSNLKKHLAAHKLQKKSTNQTFIKKDEPDLNIK